jgi:uncharacterized DUF497 family protein
MTMWDEEPEIERLAWDDWNLEHITKHHVTRDEVEQVIAGETVARATYKNRYLALGRTRGGRLLAVVIGPEPGQPRVYYTFSARPASRAERRLFDELKEGEER